jgi:hypothetical protein
VAVDVDRGPARTAQGCPQRDITKEKAVKYLCHLYYNTKKYETLTPADFAAIGETCQAHDAALKKTGQVFAVGSLAHGTAVTVRPDGGRSITTEGGRTDGQDQVGAFMIIEARDLNEAVRIASLHPAARTGEDRGWAVEVRPIEVFEQPQA